MDLGISGRVAMVAAASKGIGLATAKALAGEGCKVSICGRTQFTLDSALSEIGCGSVGFVADVSVAAEIETWYISTLSSLGPPTILVTNTGGPPAGTFADLSDEAWQTGVDSTLMNVVRLCRFALPHMIETRWGRIVHNTSLVAMDANDLLTVSTTIRAGLRGLTRAMSNQYAPHGITVNAVLPGHTMTERQDHIARIWAERNNSTTESYLEKTAATIPVRRLGQPNEIADAITFLCSERAGFISGVSLLVDGGMSHAF